MTRGFISRRIVADRMAWVEEMLSHIGSLPCSDRTAFFGDARNVWAAESCLRRALEALLDLGRHILAKGFAVGVSEYKEVAASLVTKGVLSDSIGETLRVLAGYRNRLVHFYHEVTKDELFEVCSEQLGEFHQVLSALKTWIDRHPDLVRDDDL